MGQQRSTRERIKLCNEQRVETKNGDRKDARSGEPSEKGAEPRVGESNRDTVSLSGRSNLIRMKIPRQRAYARPRGRHPRLPARPVPINGDDQLLRGPPTHPRTRSNTRQATNDRLSFGTPVRNQRVDMWRVSSCCDYYTVQCSACCLTDDRSHVLRRCYSFSRKVVSDRSSRSARQTFAEETKEEAGVISGHSSHRWPTTALLRLTRI